ncbi:hypothetical protein OI18_06145 [Flavihumibacter solisilvae]|uniref:Uncharacterized protein n=1 Tax=Flavihumibacter solisilvae TaxID=1349421 RepID=A0A0C1L7G5_9BACT|nr:hypothetical protein OI18_06145 [Flavihumibacter solisilvae]
MQINQLGTRHDLGFNDNITKNQIKMTYSSIAIHGDLPRRNPGPADLSWLGLIYEIFPGIVDRSAGSKWLCLRQFWQLVSLLKLDIPGLCTGIDQYVNAFSPNSSPIMLILV